MAWEVEFTDEFASWWQSLSEDQQDDVAYSVSLLAELGSGLGFPHSSKISDSRHSGMRELCTQSGGRPLRTLYIFTASRTAILLIDGDKTGNDRWYEQFIPVADRIYEQHLQKIRDEGVDCQRTWSVEEMEQEFGFIHQRLRQVEASALRQLRSPERARYLLALLYTGGKL